LLNFGHTVGHAIEALSHYQIGHGRAVAAGMVIETRAAVRLGLCGADCLQALLDMLARYQLPTDTDYPAAALAEACLVDKKRDGGHTTMVFPQAIGKCILKDIPVEELENVIRKGLGEQ